MNGFICVFITGFLLICSWIVYKKIYHPATFFNLIWFIFVLISLIGYPGIEQPSEKIYGILTVGCVMYNIGAFIGAMLRYRGKKNNDRTTAGGSEEIIGKTTKNIILLIQVILLIYYLTDIVVLIPKLLSGQLFYSDIRDYYYSNMDSISYIMNNYFFEPLTIVTRVFFSISVFKRIFDKKTMILMFVNLIFRVITSGGRISLVDLVVLLLVMYLIYNKQLKMTIKGKLVLGAIIAASLFLSMAITMERGVSQTDGFFDGIREMMVMNFTGSLTFFSELMERGQFENLSYFTTTFAGVVDMIKFPLNIIGFTSKGTAQIEIGNLLSKFIKIGDYYYNAMPTMYYYFWTDLKMPGVVLYSCLFGRISSAIYYRLREENTLRNNALYLMLMLVVFSSSMQWLPFKTPFVMAIVYIYLITMQKNVFMLKRSK